MDDSDYILQFPSQKGSLTCLPFLFSSASTLPLLFCFHSSSSHFLTCLPFLFSSASTFPLLLCLAFPLACKLPPFEPTCPFQKSQIEPNQPPFRTRKSRRCECQTTAQAFSSTIPNLFRARVKERCLLERWIWLAERQKQRRRGRVEGEEKRNGMERWEMIAGWEMLARTVDLAGGRVEAEERRKSGRRGEEEGT